ncbi:MAG: DMT family transporter [Verrucomicrobiales bacterium]
MKIYLYAFTVFLGVILAVHLAMNGKVGSMMNNARVANAVFWCIGAVTAILIGATGWKAGALAPLKEVSPVLLCAGALGAMLVFAIAWLIPQIGAGPLMITLLAGQVVGGLIMSHFGWLGSPEDHMNWIKIAGVILMVAGVVLVTMFSNPETPDESTSLNSIDQQTAAQGGKDYEKS